MEKTPLAIRTTLGVYVLCFAGGAYNHARDFIARGPRPYAGVPLPLEAFWSALLLLDLAVIALLLAGRRRAGLGLAAAVMVSDVAINASAAHAFGWGYGWALLLQSLFLGFVVGSAPFLWPQGLFRRQRSA